MKLSRSFTICLLPVLKWECSLFSVHGFLCLCFTPSHFSPRPTSMSKPYNNKPCQQTILINVFTNIGRMVSLPIYCQFQTYFSFQRGNRHGTVTSSQQSQQFRIEIITNSSTSTGECLGNFVKRQRNEHIQAKSGTNKIHQCLNWWLEWRVDLAFERNFFFQFFRNLRSFISGK